MRQSTLFFLSAVTLCAAASIQSVRAGGHAPKIAKVKYAEVQKIFDANCTGCHGDHGRAGIDLRSYDSVMKGGGAGAIVKPKDAAHSVLYKAVKGMPGVRRMPPRGALSDKDLKTIQNWIQQGAKK